MEPVVGEKRRRNTGDTVDEGPKRLARSASSENGTPKQGPSRANTQRKLTYADYTVGWVCALSIEGAAAEAMLDEVHEVLPALNQDTNTYTLGRIGNYNTVICRLPHGHYGTNNAASVATHLQRSFSHLKIKLMVGIGGGVPGGAADIRLGDVVIGLKTIQYDFGKELHSGVFKRTSDPVRPPQNLMTAVSKLESRFEQTAADLSTIVTRLISTQRLGKHFSYPGRDTDQLFDSEYEHDPGMNDCLDCDGSKLIPRPGRSSEQPLIHTGIIASGNRVMKNAKVRDEIAKESGAVCFEMEAAGLCDESKYLVIRGICDYCDSHKVKHWQRYAAAVAAAYAREFLLMNPTGEQNEGGDENPEVDQAYVVIPICNLESYQN